MIRITIEVDNVDYSEVVDVMLPIVKKNLENDDSAGIFKKILSDSKIAKAALKASIAVLPQNTKDEIAVSLVEKYNEKIKIALEKLLLDNGMSMDIEKIKADSVTEADDKKTN